MGLEKTSLIRHNLQNLIKSPCFQIKAGLHTHKHGICSSSMIYSNIFHPAVGSKSLLINQGLLECDVIKYTRTNLQGKMNF